MHRAGAIPTFFDGRSPTTMPFQDLVRHNGVDRQLRGFQQDTMPGQSLVQAAAALIGRGCMQDPEACQIGEGPAAGGGSDTMCTQVNWESLFADVTDDDLESGFFVERIGVRPM